MANLCDHVEKIAHFLREEHYWESEEIEKFAKEMKLEDKNPFVLELDEESRKNLKENYGIELTKVGLSELIGLAFKKLIREDKDTVFFNTFALGNLIALLEDKYPHKFEEVFTSYAETVDGESYPYLSVAQMAVEEPMIFSWFPDSEKQMHAYEMLMDYQYESTLHDTYGKYLAIHFGVPENATGLDQKEFTKVKKAFKDQATRTTFNFFVALMEEAMNLDMDRVVEIKEGIGKLESIPQEELVEKYSKIIDMYFQNFEQLFMNYYSQAAAEISTHFKNSREVQAELLKVLSKVMKEGMNKVFKFYEEQLPTFMLNEKEKFKMGLIQSTIPVAEEKITKYFNQLEQTINQKLEELGMNM
ncbi:hypothetical protein DEFDS_P106 (plasmid) [Deferribacter desulfuricans SSM1]|uniref:Uncharacterized protein n=1 Tax=Deferribacter desulfuricans (strain DSM 14783 / JCM 11476 / NBRC 101012 / SSM1) TaxID=639282 RepID=D3PET7_DEFDS|nr:hypothetical protein [Deferribacter desulfuricans]BAI81729.1 hypothetical protein DEFDS_P106 [Deferribacter desulfuricans SSM1]